MPRQRKAKPKQNEERWLITYSDLITLLMIFFVIMYAMSSINNEKFNTLKQSLNAALTKSAEIQTGSGGGNSFFTNGNSSLSVQSNPPASNNSKVVNDQKQLDNLYALVQQYIDKQGLQKFVSIVQQTRGIQITLRDVALFDTGQANLKPNAQKLLAGLVPFFASLPNQIVIEGYTDNEPIDTPEYPSNWELSSARAMDVVRFIIKQGIDPERLSGIGYGQYHSYTNNSTVSNRQLNRRVNIVVLRQGIEPGTTSSEPQ